MKMNTSSNSQRKERNDAEVQDGTHSSRLTYLPPAEVAPAFSLRGGSSGEVEKYLVDVMCVPYDMPRDRRYKWTNARIGNERTRALVFSRHPHFVKGADCDDKGPGSGRYSMVPILGLENDVVSPANCNAMLQTTIYRSSSPMQMVFRDDTIFALGYLGGNILHIQLPLVFQPGGYYVRFELSMSGDLLSVFEFRWTPESMTEDLLSRCCASSEPDVPDLIKHLTHCSKVCLAPFEQEQMANFIDNVQPLDFDGRGSRKQTIREHSTFSHAHLVGSHVGT